MEQEDNNQTEKLTPRQNAWQAFKFTLFSASAGIIQASSFTLLNELTKSSFERNYWFCYLSALTLSVLYNFTVNRRFTFKSATNVPIAMLKVVGFYLVFTPLSTWLGHLAENNGINEYLILAPTMLSNLVLEYLFCRFVVYRKSMNTNDIALRQKMKGAQKNAQAGDM